MPSVQTLLDTVKDLALVGAGDVADDARILRYMNLVNKDVWREAATSYETALLTSENVTITSGVGALSQRYFAVKAVKDTSTNTFLNSTTLVDLEDRFPALDGTGSPSWYYFTSGTAINTYPVNSGTVKVRYIPGSGELTMATAESAIQIPPEFHDVLLWGTLVYMGYDERDKASTAEVNTAQGKYEIALNAYKTWLAFQQPQEPQRTEVVLGG